MERQADIIRFLIQRTNTGQISRVGGGRPPPTLPLTGVGLFFFFFCIIFCLPLNLLVSFSRGSPHIFDPPLIKQIGLMLLLSLVCFTQHLSLFLTSDPTDYSLMKFPQNYNLPHYRFPTEGKNYISVPGAAFTMQCECKYLKL